MSTNTFVTGTVLKNYRWTDKLFSLYVQADVKPFLPGQFGRIALRIGNKNVSRPYSFVNYSSNHPSQFYAIVVENGLLSPLLYDLKPGDSVLVGATPNGFFTLDEVRDGRDLWMLSTGTAIGPYLSILGTCTPWKRFKNIILAHAVRFSEELTYQEDIQNIQARRRDQFQFIPFVSRQDFPGSIRDRIPASIVKGELEGRARLPISAQESQVMICGNPAMVKDTVAVLLERGMTKNRRRVPGHITTEHYW